jgi:hypothetical protein
MILIGLSWPRLVVTSLLAVIASASYRQAANQIPAGEVALEQAIGAPLHQ